MRNGFFIALSAALFCGCAIGPDYERPKIEAPKEFRSKSEQANISANWWELFGESELNSMVAEALTENKDVKIANSQVLQMMARFDEAYSYLFPQISANGSFARQRNSQSAAQKMPLVISNNFAAGLTLTSYEIDIWGKVRRATEAARAQLLTSEYSKEVVRLTVASGVVDAYLKLVLAREQEQLARENLATTKELMELSTKKFDVGYGSDIELQQAKSAYESARASFYSAEGGTVTAENRLTLLLGKNPISLKTKANTEELSQTPKVPAGLPSTLLERRADIAANEQTLISANALVGVAKAQYFPTISLTAGLGQQSMEFSNLFKGPSRVWQFTPSLNLPLFTAGRVDATIKEAEQTKYQAAISYEKAVQTAFSEVDSALYSYHKGLEFEDAATKYKESVQKIYELSKQKYDIGEISLPTLLAAKQNLLSAKSSLANAKVNSRIAALQLIKSLGGGWEKK